MQRRSSNSRAAFSRPAAPMRAPPLRIAPRGRAIAAASAPRSRAGTSRPVTPSSTTWRQPRMSVATTGTPIAAASIGERGKPSRCDASTKRSIARVEPRHVVARRRGSARPRPRRGRGRSAPSASSFSSSSPPITANRSVRHALAQLAAPLRTPRRSPSRARAGRRARPRRRRARSAPSSARAASSVVGRRRSPGSKRVRSMPLPSSVQLAPGHAEAGERLEVFGVLHELGVRAERRRARSSPYTTARFGERVVRLRVEAVHGVDDRPGTRGDARRDPPVDARASDCACARSSGRSRRNTETSSPTACDVLAGRDRPRRVRERDVPDPARLERVDVRPRRRDARSPRSPRPRTPRAADRGGARG